MTFEDAKRELKSYISMEKTIKQMREWINERKYDSNKVTSTISTEPKGTPKQQDQMAEKLSKLLDIEEDIDKEIALMENKQKVILKKILKLEQPYQNILFNIFIRGSTTENTAIKVGYSESHVNRLKKKGIFEYIEINEKSDF